MNTNLSVPIEDRIKNSTNTVSDIEKLAHFCESFSVNDYEKLIKAFIDTKEFVWTIRLGVRVAN